VVHINQAEKQALLTINLKAGFADGKINRALVFTRTKHGADRVVRHLSTAGVNAAAIHGNKSQAQRTAALGAFRQGSTPVLVATDIAARGIDVSGVSHVYNFEIPNVAEQYVHRIGRTARAGADGVSVSFVAPDEKPYLRDIEKLTGIKLMPQALPDDFQKEAARLPLPARKPAEAEQDARRDARDAKGRGGQGRGGPGQGRGGQGRNNNVSRGGQARDGQSRDAHARNDRAAQPRGPVFNPLGNERTEGPARPELTARPARPEGERRPAPHGDRRPAPQGDRRPPRAEGDRRPARPEGDRRPARAEGEGAPKRTFGSIGRGGPAGGSGGYRGKAPTR
jgi:ATP-dependent RNA helicase RhlE